MEEPDISVRERTDSRASSYETATELVAGTAQDQAKIDAKDSEQPEGQGKSGGQKVLRDSGLGFLEYESNSSNGDEILQLPGPFFPVRQQRHLALTPQWNCSNAIPLDVQRLMDNTWDMASSAPTSVMSERTKS